MANLVGGLKAYFTRHNAWRLGHFKWITLYFQISAKMVLKFLFPKNSQKKKLIFFNEISLQFIQNVKKIF